MLAHLLWGNWPSAIPKMSSARPFTR